jgi:DNA-binding response OmpR family regulator
MPGPAGHATVWPDDSHFGIFARPNIDASDPMNEQNTLASQTHIVVVDDEPAVRDIIRACLEMEGYRISEAGGGPELFAILEREPVHLITLDLTLGGEDGLAVARQIRAQWDTPIIMVTGKSDPIDRIVGLEIGADDYIAKPFHVREVLARVRSVLRRNQPQPAPTENGKAKEDPPGEKMVFAGWVLDCARRELRSPAGHLCPLTNTEFTLLEALARRPNRVLSRDQIMDMVRGPDWNANDRAIDNQVGRLRRKMESTESCGTLIRNVRGVGYMLSADVTNPEGRG